MDELPLKEQSALKEFGKRFRAGFAKRHPISQRSLDTVKKAVREQCEEERKARRMSSAQPPTPAPDDGPEGPEP